MKTDQKLRATYLAAYCVVQLDVRIILFRVEGTVALLIVNFVALCLFGHVQVPVPYCNENIEILSRRVADPN